MKKIFGVIMETVLWILGFDGKKRRWAVDNGLCDFSGQGRDKYGKLDGVNKVFKCTECGTVFEEGEEAVWKEDRGEFWGSPCSERMTGCPVCQGDYDEVVQCKECGEWVWNDEVDYDGLCESCQEEKE